MAELLSIIDRQQNLIYNKWQNFLLEVKNYSLIVLDVPMKNTKK